MRRNRRNAGLAVLALSKTARRLFLFYETLIARQRPVSPSSGGRNFGLDLLRFLAIAGVLVVHCGSEFGRLLGFTLPGGVVAAAFFGVELFFVLSGFLIGGILLDIAADRAGTRGFAVFMLRRWMRTLPLYFACLAAFALWQPPAPHTLALYASLTQNLAWPMPADGFFAVSWSLTIEEWFYLLFSAALIGAVALAGARWPIWPVILGFIAAPAAARHLAGMPADYFDTIYHIALLRLDAIAWGVALAKLRRQQWALFRHPVLALGFGLPLVALVWTAANTHLLAVGRELYLSAFLPVTSLGLGLCLVAACGLRRVPPVLGRPVVFGARISYGVYLTHVTILQITETYAAGHGHGGWFVVAWSLPLILLLPWASYRWFEAPILARRPPQFAAAAASVQPAAIAGIQDRSARSRAS